MAKRAKAAVGCVRSSSRQRTPPRTKDTYLSAHDHRLAARRETKKALVALGHTILVIVYHVLAGRVPYHELGGNDFAEHERQAVECHLVRRLEHLGYHVTLQPQVA